MLAEKVEVVTNDGSALNANEIINPSRGGDERSLFTVFTTFSGPTISPVHPRSPWSTPNDVSHGGFPRNFVSHFARVHYTRN